MKIQDGEWLFLNHFIQNWGWRIVLLLCCFCFASVLLLLCFCVVCFASVFHLFCVCVDSVLLLFFFCFAKWRQMKWKKLAGRNEAGGSARRRTHPLSRNPLPRRDHHRDLKTETLVKLSWTSSQRPRPKAKKTPLDRGSRTAGRPDHPTNSIRPPLATAESSRAHSFARTHATQTQAQSKSISQFGCCLTTVSHPQPPILCKITL